MDKYRLIASTIVMLIYLLVVYPRQTVIWTVILGIAYLVLRKLSYVRPANNAGASARRAALSEARIYLAPYKNIWANLRLSNKYCTLRLGRDGQTITAKETINPYRAFRIIESNVHSYEALWNMFCKHFDHNTSYDNLLEMCKTFNAGVKTEGGENKVSQTFYNNYTGSQNSELAVDINSDINSASKQEKLDVNNASEVELTALPGVSIVLAKKLIKKREEIGGFKTVNDVCMFLRLKPHIQKQLEALICVNKMKGSVGIKRNKERCVDL